MSKNNDMKAFLICVASFFTWGALAVYWHQLNKINAVEIVAHRAVWALMFTGILVLIVKQGTQVKGAFKDYKTLLALTASSSTIALNWSLYIWAVTHDNIIQTSMGYYINPLFNVAASALIFKTSMNKAQIIAVIFALIGVANLVIGYGSVPWIALSLAASFSVYGVIRKIVKIDALPGLFIETLIISIPSAIYIVYLTMHGKGVLIDGENLILSLLIIGGLLTTLPLAGFAYGARHLSLGTVGIIQYISPTVSFSIGVFLYKEVFTLSHLITFAFIWTGIIIYSADALIKMHKYRVK